MTQADTAVAIDRLRELLRREPMVAITSLDGTAREPLVCFTVPERDSLITAYESKAERLREVEGALEREERDHGVTIDQRDRAEAAADRLADIIADLAGADIGEHTSANDPWRNAIDEGSALTQSTENGE